MVTEIKLYVEGGGKGTHKRATIKLQQGFDTFFRALKDIARSKGISFKVIPSSDTQSTYDEFILSVENSPHSFNLLLVDSDGAVDENVSARAFLQRKYRKWKLQAVADEQCHLMVQIMEAWFIADVDALQKFYGQEFKVGAIPKSPNIEAVDKGRIETALKAATVRTQKGEYHKINHGGKLLELVSPQKVRAAAPHCDKLFVVLEKALE